MLSKQESHCLTFFSNSHPTTACPFFFTSYYLATEATLDIEVYTGRNIAAEVQYLHGSTVSTVRPNLYWGQDPPPELNLNPHPRRYPLRNHLQPSTVQQVARPTTVSSP